MKKTLKNIFLSSIRQNIGKTTVSLGLHSMLKERNLNTAFMKPVGQRFVNVGNLQVDKDSYLLGEVFHCCKSIFKDMSPVTIARGYTEEYIAHPKKEHLQKSIEQAYAHLIDDKDAIIVEGTGHAGVGSVIDFSNADVARLLKSKVIIVSEGGIGRAIDEIMLNKALFDLKGVDVIGVIINKVIPEKYEKIKKIVAQGLKNKGIELFGVIPMQPLLSSPTVDQICFELGLRFLCGEDNGSRHIGPPIVAAMEPYNTIHYFLPDALVITPGDRIDNILLAISSHFVKDIEDYHISGIILTGGLVPNEKILHLLRKSKMPILVTEDDTYTVAAKIKSLTCKIQKTDIDKIQEAARLVKEYVDVDKILSLC